MSEEPARQSHFMAWTLSIVAVLVLYMLSVGPVLYLAERGTIPVSLHKGLQDFYRPLEWIYFNTPLRAPIDLSLIHI